MLHVDDGRLSAFLDGELDAPLLEAAERHLDDCGDCRARLEDLRRVRDLAHAVLAAASPPETAPPSFATLRARARSAPPSPARRWTPAVAWAASVALALAFGWQLRDRLAGGETELLQSPATASSTPASPESAEQGREERAMAVSAPAPAAAGRAQAVADRPEAAAPASPEVEALPARTTSPGTAGNLVRQPGLPEPSLALAAMSLAPSLLPHRVETLTGSDADPPVEPTELARAESAGVTLESIAVAGAPVAGAEAAAIAVPRAAPAAAAPLGKPVPEATEDRSLLGRVTDAVFGAPGAQASGLPAVSPPPDLGPRPAVPQTRETRSASAAIRRGLVRDVGWTRVAPEEAERWLGRGLLVVDGLPLRSVSLAVIGGRAVVRVEQQLEDGGSLELVQSLAEHAAPRSAAGVELISDGLRVGASGPLGPEQLRGLLERLRIR